MTDDIFEVIQYGNTGSGDFAMVTESSIKNNAILLGNKSIYGDAHFVVYRDNVDRLIEALLELKKYETVDE